MEDLPGYDNWKLASPPYLEDDEEDELTDEDIEEIKADRALSDPDFNRNTGRYE